MLAIKNDELLINNCLVVLNISGKDLKLGLVTGGKSCSNLGR